MRFRPLALLLTLICAVWTAQVSAQQGIGLSTLQSRVFDLLFPRDVGTPLYFSKTTLRFSDSASQFVIILFGRATGKGEVYHYRVRETDRKVLSERIAKAFMDNRETTTAATIASGIRVETMRTVINAAPFVRVLDELKAIQLSPLLENRVCLDECATYEFSHDTGQELVHYAINRPSGDSRDEWPHDKLGRWMTSVQSRLPALLAEAADPAR